MAGDFDFDDLRRVDLSKLDLDHIDLGVDRPRVGFWHWLAALVLIAGAGVVLWLPGSAFYRQGTWVFFGTCAVAVVLGLLAGRWLWGWVQIVVARPRAPVDAAQRSAVAWPLWGKWLVLGVLLVLALTLLLARELIASNSLETLSFLLAGGALVLGALGAIWLVRRFDEMENRGRRGPSGTSEFD